MEDIERLVKTALGEVEKLLNTKSVVGDPIVAEGNTIIPLVSIGFGFGVGGGGGSGKGAKSGGGEGTGSGTGGFGGIKPVGIIVVSKDTVKVEPVKGSTASVLERVGEVIGKAVEKHGEKKRE